MGPDHPNIIKTLSNMTGLYQQMGRLEQATEFATPRTADAAEAGADAGELSETRDRTEDEWLSSLRLNSSAQPGELTESPAPWAGALRTRQGNASNLISCWL